MEIESGRKKISEDACRARAAYFTKERFQQEILSAIKL
jgi:hypothetical protein